jgi:hypothetical protein
VKARRLIIDALVIVVSLGLLVGFYLLPDQLPYSRVRPIKPYSKVRPIKQGKLVVSAPSFGWGTNGEHIYCTVTLTLSNASPFDLECGLNWFDWRATNDFDAPQVVTSGQHIVLPRGATGQFTRVVAPRSSSAFTGQLCCYKVDWGERASWLEREVGNHPDIEGFLKHGSGLFWPVGDEPWNRMREQGRVFGSNLPVQEYFRLVHGLDKAHLAAEEARISSLRLPRDAAAELFRLRYGMDADTNGRKAALEAAEKPLELQRLDSRERRLVRWAYKEWLDLQVDATAESGGPSKTCPPRPGDGGTTNLHERR